MSKIGNIRWRIFTIIYLLNIVVNLIAGLFLLLMVDTLNTYRFLSVPLPRYLVIIFAALLLYFGYWELRSLFRKRMRGKNFLFISVTTLLFGLIILVSLFLAQYLSIAFWVVLSIGGFLSGSGLVFLLFYRLSVGGETNVQD